MMAHPHLNSGMSAMASGAAFVGTTLSNNVHTFAQATLLTDENIKWTLSMMASVAFGGFAIYCHILERMELSKLKRDRMASDAKRDDAAKQADAELEAKAKATREDILLKEEAAYARLRVERKQAEQCAMLKGLEHKAESIESKVDVAQTAIQSIAEKVDAVVAVTNTDVTVKTE